MLPLHDEAGANACQCDACHRHACHCGAWSLDLDIVLGCSSLFTRLQSTRGLVVKARRRNRIGLQRLPRNVNSLFQPEMLNWRSKQSKHET